MTRVQLTHETSRKIKIFKYEFRGGKNVRTDEVLREDTVTHRTVLFSGSYEAYKIYKAGHHIPYGAKMVTWMKGHPPTRKQDQESKPESTVKRERNDR